MTVSGHGSTFTPVETTVSVDIDAPQEQVFDLMADVRNEPEWNSQVSKAELRSGEPVGLGSRFMTVNRGQEYEAVITGYTRPSDLTFEVSGKAMTIQGRVVFTGDAARSHLDAEFDMQPRGFMKVMLPLMSPLIRRDFPKQFASFKAFCEARSGGPSGPSAG